MIRESENLDIIQRTAFDKAKALKEIFLFAT